MKTNREKTIVPVLQFTGGNLKPGDLMSASHINLNTIIPVEKLPMIILCFVCALVLTIALYTPVMADNSKALTVLPGGDEWKVGFDGQRAWDHVAVLASDSLAGRYSGFRGSDKADSYITAHFQRLGLEGPFDDDGYFHHFTYGAGEYTIPSSLLFHLDNGTIDTAYMWQDFNIYKYSGFGKVKGRLLFVGYGISAPEKGWDDYEDIDVTGAVVLAMRDLPEVADIEWDDERASGYKSTTALQKGAIGFILTDDETPKYATITEKYYRAELPAVWISSILADTLLHKTGKTKGEWADEIKKTGKPVSRELNVEVELHVSGEYFPERPTRNIVGVIPGSDPELSHETVLIGAHMDHHGVDAAGNIYPGADDNASGTATMMELAELFSQSPVRHKRSLMFAGFAAEEEGLVGSKKLVEDLPIGDYRIVTMINMDMVGQGDGSTGVGGINEFPLLGELMFTDWPDSALEELKFWSLYPGSDHASFRGNGIPSYVVGARDKHPNYHTPNDTAGAIKPDVMKAVGEMVYHLAEVLTDHPESLTAEVDKARWLLHRSGAVEFINIDSQFTRPFRAVKGVEYPVPVVFLNLLRGNDKVLGLEDVLRNLETARETAEMRSIPFMADSLQKDYKADVFTGMTAVLPVNSLPNSAEALKGLTRLGLSFVDLTELVSSKSSMNKKTKQRLGKLAAKCHESSVRPILSFVDVDIALQTGKQWHGQLLYRVKSGFNWARLSDFTEAGCFVLIQIEGDGEKAEYAAMADMIKQALTSDSRNHFGLIASHTLVQALLDIDVSNEDIIDLLQGNLRRELKRWWAATED